MSGAKPNEEADAVTDATAEFDPLETRLRQLFRDQRLDLTPAQGAPLAIMAGARRRRRRRELAVVVSGSVAAAVVLIAGFVFTSPMADREVEVPIAAPALTKTVTVSTVVPIPHTEAETADSRRHKPMTSGPASAPPAGTGQQDEQAPPPVESGMGGGDPEETELNNDQPLFAAASIGPGGYGDLRIGMTFDEVKDKGLLADPDAQPPAEGCAPYALAEGDQSVREVLISSGHGVSVITASGASTPEGVAIGSSLDDVKAAYPDVNDDGWGYRARAQDGVHYRFRLGEDGEAVTELHLVRDEQDCGKF